MTTPVVTPSKAKAWWALLIPAVGSLVPTLLQYVGVLPAPWGPAVTGILLIFAAVTGVAVHQAPYMPSGTVIAPEATPPAVPSNPISDWPNPWGPTS